MQGSKLARIRWYLGQTLRPEHFATQEEALLEEVRLRSRLGGLPETGVAHLAWNVALLAQGTIAISSLTAVMPGGLLVDVPGNAVLQPLALPPLKKTRPSVYLHVLEERRTSEGVALYADDARTVSRSLYRALLSTDPAVEGVLGTLKLAEMEQDLNGSWHLGEGYVPPLVLVGQSPFLRDLLDEVATLLDTFRAQLVEHLSDGYTHRDRLVNVRRCLTELVELQQQLGDINYRIYPHPYRLFEKLRRFYFELCYFQDALPEPDLPPYLHDDLGTTFGRWRRLFERRLQPVSLRSHHQAFAKREGMFVLTPVPAEATAAREIYLLVKQAQDQPPRPLDGVKLASPTRLGMVHRLALKGVPLTRVIDPRFPHSFGPEVDFYQLGSNEEWHHAVREGALAFHVPPTYDRAQVSLFWREA